MKICVIGAGYVGLVTAACFAERGSSVACVDVDADKIARLSRGEIPFFEPGLDDLVRKNLDAGSLAFYSDISLAMPGVDVCFIAVGTPPAHDGGADIGQVLGALDSIASCVERDCFIVVKSTVPVGVGALLRRRIADRLGARGMDIRCEVLSNPEFLREGSAVSDCMSPDRVVIGAQSEEASRVMVDLYRPFAPIERIFVMDPASAEITKYAANAMLASRISLMNEIANLCDAAGADIVDVRAGLASDRRIGPYFLNAGCGYGGSCFPKDVNALVRSGEFYGLDMTLASAVEKVNSKQKEILGAMVRDRFGEMMGMRCAVLGLAFKPGTSDMREAPSISLVNGLIGSGASVAAYDPAAAGTASRLLPSDVIYERSAMDALRGADFAVIVTEWPEFASLDWRAAAAIMRGLVLFDGRNMLDPDALRGAGFEYYCIGRGMVPRAQR